MTTFACILQSMLLTFVLCKEKKLMMKGKRLKESGKERKGQLKLEESSTR